MVARLKHVSIVTHTCGDVSLAINIRNSFFVLAHTVHAESDLTDEENGEDHMELSETRTEWSRSSSRSGSIQSWRRSTM